MQIKVKFVSISVLIIILYVCFIFYVFFFYSFYDRYVLFYSQKIIYVMVEIKYCHYL